MVTSHCIWAHSQWRVHPHIHPHPHVHIHVHAHVHVLCCVCVAGKQHGFLAGNVVYYVPGTFLVQTLFENETVGLTHPFFNDLRARGTGIATHPDTGTGNDYRGWEFYRSSKVAYGTVIMGDIHWVHPAPSHMYFRPCVHERSNTQSPNRPYTLNGPLRASVTRIRYAHP